jgi:hypothetical protein
MAYVVGETPEREIQVDDEGQTNESEQQDYQQERRISVSCQEGRTQLFIDIFRGLAQALSWAATNYNSVLQTECPSRGGTRTNKV